MRLGTILHLVIWPSLALVGGLLLFTPSDILRQPVILQPVAARSVASIGTANILPATLTVKATALPPGAGVPRQRPVLPEPVAAAPPVPVAPPVTQVDQRWITAGALNLRSGPSVNTALLASLPFGTPVEVLDTSGNWARVAVGGREGWLSTRFLSTDAPD